MILLDTNVVSAVMRWLDLQPPEEPRWQHAISVIFRISACPDPFHG